MARTKSKTDPVKIAAQRLLEDEELQKHLRVAGTRLHEAWDRASSRGASKATRDKKVYDKVRQAAASLAVAGGRLRKKPEPKHHGRKVVVGAALAGGAALAVKKARTNGNGSTVAATREPVPAPTPPLAAV